MIRRYPLTVKRINQLSDKSLKPGMIPNHKPERNKFETRLEGNGSISKVMEPQIKPACLHERQAGER
jgi:hypothetical protein